MTLKFPKANLSVQLSGTLIHLYRFFQGFPSLFSFFFMLRFLKFLWRVFSKIIHFATLLTHAVQYV